jgi:hypothetical protein
MIGNECVGDILMRLVIDGYRMLGSGFLGQDEDLYCPVYVL